jgi:hypothetical protein
MPDEDQRSLRQADQIRLDLYVIRVDLDFIIVQFARLPTRNEVWPPGGARDARWRGGGRHFD